jgi:hypothetical protein
MVATMSLAACNAGILVPRTVVADAPTTEAREDSGRIYSIGRVKVSG